jgi:hypothetical protein
VGTTSFSCACLLWRARVLMLPREGERREEAEGERGRKKERFLVVVAFWLSLLYSFSQLERRECLRCAGVSASNSQEEGLLAVRARDGAVAED